MAVAGSVVVAVVNGGSYLMADVHTGRIAAFVSQRPTAAPPGSPAPAPATTTATTRVAEPECDPHYPGICIPPPSYAGDVDCRQLATEGFRVIPPDPHHLDEDNDGIACEADQTAASPG